MLAELRSAQAAGHAERFRRAAHSLKSNAKTFGALRWARWRASSNSGGLARRRAPASMRCEAEYAARRRRVEGPDPWLSAARGCWSPTTTRSTGCCWRAASSCRATSVDMRRERPRRARDAARASRFDLLLLDMEMPEMDGFQVLEQLAADSAAARPAGHRHPLARRRGARRALHRARRRRLPAQAGESGAAEGAHRLQPGEEAPARPAEGAGASASPPREVAQDMQQSGFALGGKRVHGHGDVLRHPRLHLDGRGAAAGGDDRAAEHLVHADVRRHQRRTAAWSTR